MPTADVADKPFSRRVQPPDDSRRVEDVARHADVLQRPLDVPADCQASDHHGSVTGPRPTRKLPSYAVEAVEVRWSPRARRWRLEVPWGEAPRLTVPQGTSRAGVQRLLEGTRPWIEEQRRRQVPRLCLDPSVVSEPKARAAARELVQASAQAEAERIGVEYRRIRIAGQRTLWGSCSRRGTLSFNWRLVLAPPEVLDYVVVHELCHLRVHGHSRRFWSLVERHRPGYRDQRSWLREHGPELLAFRPAR